MGETGMHFLAVWASPLLALLLVPLVGLGVYLFFSLKGELRLLARNTPVENASESEAVIRALGVEVERLRGRVSEIEIENKRKREQRTAADGSLQPEMLNSHRRGQILRLHHTGKALPEIASALRIPLGEVELMMKVLTLSQGAGQDLAAESVQ